MRKPRSRTNAFTCRAGSKKREKKVVPARSRTTSWFGDALLRVIIHRQAKSLPRGSIPRSLLCERLLQPPLRPVRLEAKVYQHFSEYATVLHPLFQPPYRDRDRYVIAYDYPHAHHLRLHG
jgi:hypothetical protein